MALTSDEQSAQKAGWALPEGSDLISRGDDAIRQNAVKSHKAIASGDSSTLSSANAYTDGQIASVPTYEYVDTRTEHSPKVVGTLGDWRLAETDEDGVISRAVDEHGRTWINPHPDSPGLVDPSVAGEIQPLDNESWAWAVADSTGRVALGVLESGEVYTGDSRSLLPYDVILIVGQSNAKGTGYPLINTDPIPGIDQFPAANKPEGGTIIPATEPLLHQGPVSADPGTGFGVPFARAYMDKHPGRRVLLVPSAWGATGFSTSAPAQGGTWDWTALDDGTNLARNALRQVKAALEAAGDGARLAGIIWHQGEGDGSIADTYHTYLDGLISWFRTELGDPSIPFVVGQMSPDRQGGANGVTIDAAHQQTPARVERTAFAPTPPGLHNPGDKTHLSSRAFEIIGPRMADALDRAGRNVSGDGPIGPENVRTKRVGDTITVTWEPAWCRVTDYRIEWRTGAGEWTTAGVVHEPSLSTTASFTTADPAEVRVITLNSSGESTPVHA